MPQSALPGARGGLAQAEALGLGAQSSNPHPDEEFFMKAGKLPLGRKPLLRVQHRL